MSNPKERILTIALSLFHQQGYNRTGINQIIADAKVAKASFYQHFKSKDELCVAYLNHRHMYWFSELHLFTEKFHSSKEKIIASFDFLIHMNDQEDFRGCSFLNILSEISKDQPEILHEIQSHKKDLRMFFQQLTSKIELSEQVYLLFEAALIESQLFRSNELIERSKSIINKLIKN
ncbi:TetR/AcrR family transcriptional regulator [Sphingobacterium sp. SRCM116780]|uniref:TetR/AcrR family transcriptional regulator n=1 Tax=Sphingobacterium sp. SRCM116780 TaxID=2907623 RepID=UPI001F2FA668|nr:TetR/AcrR family transcriptional regulator [Sphingobacterium sp. SRCM116780]UIR54900.1 TetR/AcrR family transcriptional regulator [Sphingobacterium sp. SRCM116780]